MALTLARALKGQFPIFFDEEHSIQIDRNCVSISRQRDGSVIRYIFGKVNNALMFKMITDGHTDERDGLKGILELNEAAAKKLALSEVRYGAEGAERERAQRLGYHFANGSYYGVKAL